MTSGYFKQLAKARRLAKENGEAWAVVEMDYQDSRRVYAVPLLYTFHDEYEAFGGQLLATVEPDGLVECFA